MALMETLTDKFIGTTLDATKWSWGGIGGSVNNKLYINTGKGGTNSTAYAYTRVDGQNVYYDMNGSYVYANITWQTDQPEMRLRNASNYGITLTFTGNGTDIALNDSTGVIGGSMSAVEGTYVRVRNSGTTWYVDSSEDAVNWTQEWSASSSMDKNMYLLFGAMHPYSYDAMTVQSVNLPLTTTHSQAINGQMRVSATFNGDQTHYRTISGQMRVSATLNYTRVMDTSIPEEKVFLGKVYDADDNYLGVIDDIINEPTFTAEVNSAGSSLTLELARNSDSVMVELEPLLDSDNQPILDSSGNQIMTSRETRNAVGLGSLIAHGNRVDVYVYYKNALDGLRKFSGFIVEIGTKYGGNENTTLLLYSYGYDLDQYVVESAGDTTVPFLSVDPSDIIRTSMNALPTLSAGATYTTYTNATVPLTGTVVSYTYKANTYKEMLDKVVQLAPNGWFYYVGLGDNLVHFKQKGNVPDHRFMLGKHIKELDLKSYSGDSKNDVLFTGGGDPALYRRKRRTPLAGIRRGLERMSDNRVELTSSADILMDGVLDEREGIQFRSTVTILDTKYDIETINVGDTIGYGAFDNYVDELTMTVVSMDYAPDEVVLHLDTLPPAPSKRLEDLKRNLNQQENENVPDAPVEV